MVGLIPVCGAGRDRLAQAEVESEQARITRTRPQVHTRPHGRTAIIGPISAAASRVWVLKQINNHAGVMCLARVHAVRDLAGGIAAVLGAADRAQAGV